MSQNFVFILLFWALTLTTAGSAENTIGFKGWLTEHELAIDCPIEYAKREEVSCYLLKFCVRFCTTPSSSEYRIFCTLSAFC